MGSGSRHLRLPAVDTLAQELGAGRSAPEAIEAAARTARGAAEATKGMLAQRGRASYTGERSTGSVDAGAMAVAVIFEQSAGPGARPASSSQRGGEDPHETTKLLASPKGVIHIINNYTGDRMAAFAQVASPA